MWLSQSYEIPIRDMELYPLVFKWLFFSTWLPSYERALFGFAAATHEHVYNQCLSEVVEKKSIQIASLANERRRKKGFRVIAFSRMYNEMIHNHSHKHCAVKLKIISVNMSCNCQISPLVRPNPTEAFALPQCSRVSALKHFKRPSGRRAGQWPQSRVCHLFHLQISPSTPTTPQVFARLLSLSLFIVKAAIITDMRPVYSHFSSCLFACVPPLQDRLCSYLHTSMKESANITFTSLNDAAANSGRR